MHSSSMSYAANTESQPSALPPQWTYSPGIGDIYGSGVPNWGSITDAQKRMAQIQQWLHETNLQAGPPDVVTPGNLEHGSVAMISSPLDLFSNLGLPYSSQSVSEVSFPSTVTCPQMAPWLPTPQPPGPPIYR